MDPWYHVGPEATVQRLSSSSGGSQWDSCLSSFKPLPSWVVPRCLPEAGGPGSGLVTGRQGRGSPAQSSTGTNRALEQKTCNNIVLV